MLHLRRLTRIIFLLASIAVAAHAQVTVAGKTPPTDSVFIRARQLVVSGNGAAGRLLVDSVIAATPPDTPAYGEALYWRAALAATSTDAERDYRRLVVEYPLSPRTADALLQLSQLELARGDKQSAALHLERFLLENPQHPEHVRAGVTLVRLLFEQNDLPRGCSVLRRTLHDLPQSEVETRNQLEYYSPRCAAADANPGSQLPLPKTDSAGRDSIRRDSTKGRPTHRDNTQRESTHAAAAEPARYTLQIAAYKSKTEAEQLAKKLNARGFEARVVTSGKLSRVRVGRYATRAAAVAAQKDLKAKKISAFVTDIESGAK